MVELKPCPFCGGQAKFFTKVNDAKNTSIGWFFGIFCTECGVTMMEEIQQQQKTLKEVLNRLNAIRERLG